MVRTILNECFHCKKMFAKPQNRLMPDLPKEQFAINKKPFSKTRIDYFGPIYVKTSKRTQSTQRNYKRYGVLFTCLTTRAIHLEVAGDLSADLFIMSLTRFISRP